MQHPLNNDTDKDKAKRAFRIASKARLFWFPSLVSAAPDTPLADCGIQPPEH